MISTIKLINTSITSQFFFHRNRQHNLKVYMEDAIQIILSMTEIAGKILPQKKKKLVMIQAKRI